MPHSSNFRSFQTGSGISKYNELETIRGLHVEMETVQTNMILFDILDARWDAAGLTGALGEAGVLCNATRGDEGPGW